jgi:hypothetical protein
MAEPVPFFCPVCLAKLSAEAEADITCQQCGSQRAHRTIALQILCYAHAGDRIGIFADMLGKGFDWSVLMPGMRQFRLPLSSDGEAQFDLIVFYARRMPTEALGPAIDSLRDHVRDSGRVIVVTYIGAPLPGASAMARFIHVGDDPVSPIPALEHWVVAPAQSIDDALGTHATKLAQSSRYRNRRRAGIVAHELVPAQPLEA